MSSPAAISIRMYNVGFGDCFLLRFHDSGHKVLIDCGRHQLNRTGPTMDRVLAQLQQDITDPDGVMRIALVVATHRHADHVSGFAADFWKQVQVEEVWMPWTEDPDCPEARRICELQSARAKRVRKTVEAIPHLAPDRLEYMLGFAGNNMTNEAAMDVLHNGFATGTGAKRRFLPAKSMDRKPGSASSSGSDAHASSLRIPGLAVRVLGPSRSEDVIREMDPPAEESFLALLEQGAGSLDEAQRQPPPFSAAWRMSRQDYEAACGEKSLEDFSIETAERMAAIEEDALALLASLHKAINGTSLVLLFEFGGHKLLFPGDAQWGTWKELLANHRKALEGLKFLKLGHHGSHNATPKQILEGAAPLLAKGARVMIPTAPIGQWPDIPKKELLASLEANGVEFVRSDDGVPHFQSPVDPFIVHADGAEVLYIDTSFG